MAGKMRGHVFDDSDRKRHIFGDEWKYKVGGRRKSRSAKIDRAESLHERIWDW